VDEVRQLGFEAGEGVRLRGSLVCCHGRGGGRGLVVRDGGRGEVVECREGHCGDVEA
jgi:hypothetical protein